MKMHGVETHASTPDQPMGPRAFLDGSDSEPKLVACANHPVCMPPFGPLILFGGNYRHGFPLHHVWLRLAFGANNDVVVVTVRWLERRLEHHCPGRGESLQSQGYLDRPCS